MSDQRWTLKLLHYYLRDEPTPPEPGDRALCGHVRTKEWDGEETGERCVVCEEQR